MNLKKCFYNNDQVIHGWILYLIIFLCTIILSWTCLNQEYFHTQSKSFTIQHIEYIPADICFMNRIDPQTIITTLNGRKIILKGHHNTPPIGTEAVVFCDGWNTYIKPIKDEK